MKFSDQHTPSAKRKLYRRLMNAPKLLVLPGATPRVAADLA